MSGLHPASSHRSFSLSLPPCRLNLTPMPGDAAYPTFSTSCFVFRTPQALQALSMRAFMYHRVGDGPKGQASHFIREVTRADVSGVIRIGGTSRSCSTSG